MPDNPDDSTNDFHADAQTPGRPRSLSADEMALARLIKRQDKIRVEVAESYYDAVIEILGEDGERVVRCWSKA